MKFFNRLRFKLFKENNFTKYLLYAIGEIILVVIGILIALYINNWNTEKQLSESNIELQKKVHKQMKLDLADLNEFQQELISLDQVYLKTLGRKHEKSEMALGGMITTLLFEVKTVDINQQVVEWIDNAELDDSKTSEELLSISSMYKLYFKYIGNIEKVIFEKLASNLEEIEETQDWYTDLVTDFNCKDSCVRYLLYDEGHKARIASLRLLYIQSYANIIDGFYNDLEQESNKFGENIEME